MGRNEAAGSCTCACNPRNEACIQDFCFFFVALPSSVGHDTQHSRAARAATLVSASALGQQQSPYVFRHTGTLPSAFGSSYRLPLSLQCRSLGICPRQKRVAKLLTYHGTYTYAIVVSKKGQKSPPSASAREEQGNQELPIEG